MVMQVEIMNKLEIQAKVENLEKVLFFLDTELESRQVSNKTQMQLDLAVEELFVNIANYSYPGGEGMAEIDVDFDESVGNVKVILIDSGIPYNPLEKPDPDITLGAMEREIGGLGIFMVKKNVDDIKYLYSDGKNILTLYKSIS